MFNQPMQTNNTKTQAQDEIDSVPAFLRKKI